MSRPVQKGFTLVEVMAATAISMVAVIAAANALVGQYGAIQGHDLARMANGSARDATQFLDYSLRLAGFGIDPRWGIDFSYRCAGQPCRDSTTGPDELVVVNRDPKYRYLAPDEVGCGDPNGCFSGDAWPITSATTNPPSLRVTLGPGTKFEAGRVVLALCAAARSPVMLTLASPVSAPSAGGPLSVVLNQFSADATLGAYNATGALQQCHGQPGAALFLVDRSRFFVQSLNGTPWLMLDSGRDLDGDGVLPPADQDDLIPVAKNVLDMQVAYSLDACPGYASGPDSNGDWIVGNVKEQREEPLLLTNPAAPTYDTPSSDPSRCTTLSPANVRGVRISMRLRSDRPDHSKPAGWSGDVMKGPENRNGTLNVPGYRLFTAELNVTLRNMASSTPFLF